MSRMPTCRRVSFLGWLVLLLCFSALIAERGRSAAAAASKDNQDSDNEDDDSSNASEEELLDALDTILNDVAVGASFFQQNHDGGLLWKDLSVTTSQNNETLLNTCSGFVPNGNLLAILGPSGSGKSTFLAALSGRSQHIVEGHVIYSMTRGASPSSPHGNHNENDETFVHEDIDDDGFVVVSPDPSQVAWLSQHDHFFSMLTPRETLQLAAFLELPHWKEKERKQLVQVQLESIGLSHAADRIVGSSDDSTVPTRQRLSGGERRRLSVALELLTHELFLLADEPTTGLDAALAVTVLNLIQLQAQQRQIPALASLHQPRSSAWHNTIDYVLLMAPGGNVCYCGPKEECLPYFESIGYPCPALTNPAEFLVDLVSISSHTDGDPVQDRARVQHLAKTFRQYQTKHWNDPSFAVPILNSAPPAPSFSTSFFQRSKNKNPQQTASSSSRGPRPQSLFHKSPIARFWTSLRVTVARFGALFRRSWRQNIRNGTFHLVRFVVSIGNAILLGKIYPSVGLPGSPPTASSVADRVALLSFGAITMAFMAFMKAVTVFAEEKPVIHREQMRRQYSAFEYLSAKALAELPMDSFFGAVFTTVLKYCSGVRIPWIQVTGVFSLLTVATASLGFMIGSWAPPTEKLAVTASIPILVILMVVGVINPSGVDPNHQTPALVQALKSVSPFRFAIEALCLGEYPGMDFTAAEKDGGLFRWFRKLKGLPRMGGLALVQNGDQVIEALGLQHQTFTKAMADLAVLSAKFLGLSWLGLQLQEWLSRQRPTKRPKQKKTAGSPTSLPLVKVPTIRGRI